MKAAVTVVTDAERSPNRSGLSECWLKISRKCRVLLIHIKF